MQTLSETQKLNILSHMLTDSAALKIKLKAFSPAFESKNVLHAEVENYEKMGWAKSGRETKRKATIIKPKETSVYFEHQIWCLFYNLGFRILNEDEKLVVKWGPNDNDTQQLDVVAVGEDAIFVVECKASQTWQSHSFKKDINAITQYMGGVSDVLKAIYGQDKKVKFIFATKQYRFPDDSEDKKRLDENDIFHLDDNAYKYINSLISSYKKSVIYQFHGLMFKDQLINDKKIRIPALRGKMGDQMYYLFSIEPSILLKIGFVLHRTKVNDFWAPTYQRLLVSKRLAGISKFINKGGFFPNSIIINFHSPNKEIKCEFTPLDSNSDSQAELGYLTIPNAYSFAFIIDGQHRVYGYANTEHKDTCTIPVVAFEDMESSQQLRIFVEINENQKAVSKDLKIDLQENLNWESENLEQRMSALRSATIKRLTNDTNSVLYDKISMGEDKAILSSPFFDSGLSASGLFPKAKSTKWSYVSDYCLYDVNETDASKAMEQAKTKAAQLVGGVFGFVADNLSEEDANKYLFQNRAAYAVTALIGDLMKYVFALGKIDSKSTIPSRISSIEPFLLVLAKSLTNLSNVDDNYLKKAYGSGGDKAWLRSYQNLINKQYPDFIPEGLTEWKETQDEDIQKTGAKLKDEIKELMKRAVFACLNKDYGTKWESQLMQTRHDCEGRILNAYRDTEDAPLEKYDWQDWIEISDLRKLISDHFSTDSFEEAFSIDLGNGSFKSKKDKLAWMARVEPSKGKKAIPLTLSDNNKLTIIRNHLINYCPEE